MKVLIVEDDRPMRELIRRIIGDLVDEFYECTGGCDAVTAYDAGHPDWVPPDWVSPDWVLMDIRMRDGDGLAATEQIMTAHPDARVIIVTSYNDASLREAARKAGARGYVLKENLLEIRRWLSKTAESPASK